MLKNPKAKGNLQEHKAMRRLEEEGYWTCRSGGSLGIFDIIAIAKPDGRTIFSSRPFRLVQVKSNRYPRKEEMKALNEFEVAEKDLVSKELWIYYDHKRDPKIIKL